MTPRLPDDIRTPAYVLDVAALKRNLATAARIKREAGIKILLATKAWAMPAAFPLMKDVLDGTTASGEYEARMGREEFGKEVHVYAPAYAPGEVERLTAIADHIYFNSPEQIARGLQLAKAAGLEVGHVAREGAVVLLANTARFRADFRFRADSSFQNQHRLDKGRPAQRQGEKSCRKRSIRLCPSECW